MKKESYSPTGRGVGDDFNSRGSFSRGEIKREEREEKDGGGRRNGGHGGQKMEMGSKIRQFFLTFVKLFFKNTIILLFY